MPLYPTIKGLVDDNINTNGIQYITGAIHNDVMNELIDHVGAAQVYVNPATTDDPGTPENPRAYIALPGTYTNFGGMVVTAPLGVLKWDGTDWSVTQLTIPSGHNYFLAETTQTRTIGTPYTTVTISQSNGGYTASAGHWVKLISRRTGKYEFVQLAADVVPADTSLTFESRTFAQTIDSGAIVEIFPTIGMRWWATIPLTSEGLDYCDMTTGWRPPPVETVEYTVYMERLIITRNGLECQYDPAPTTEYQYKLNDSNRLRIEFGTAFADGEIVRVKLWQPAVLETYNP